MTPPRPAREAKNAAEAAVLRAAVRWGDWLRGSLCLAPIEKDLARAVERLKAERSGKRKKGRAKR